MAITINWGTRVINVPQADLTNLGGGIYELDLNAFRLQLKNLEDDVDGITFPNTHNHFPPVLVSGTLVARVIELINNYTVTFENGSYAVNLVGANSNVSEKTNVNQVSVRSFNSTGLVTVSENVLTAQQIQWLQELYKIHGLESGSPLTVTATSRAAGGVSQTISESSGTVTVTRT